MDLGYPAAFLGGALALLSPCGALLLPAFFAATAGSGARLLGHGAVFFAGLSVILVPLGLGASVLGGLLTAHRDLVVTVAGWLIIALGVAAIAGWGFDLARLVPGSATVRERATGAAGPVRSFLLGTVSGVAGFCSGPILGAVLTLAATSGQPLTGATMLAVYGAGMVVPLLAVAAAWQRLGARGRARLRGGQLRVGRWSAPTLSVVTGLVLIAVGVAFLVTDGMAALPELVPATVLAGIQSGVAGWSARIAEPVVIGLLALLALATWWVVTRRAARRRAPTRWPPARRP